MTSEDLIEFVHLSQQAAVDEPKILAGATSFAGARRSALQRADVVMAGEPRDSESLAVPAGTARLGNVPPAA